MVLTDVHALLADEVASPDEGSPVELNDTSKAQNVQRRFFFFHNLYIRPTWG